MKKISTLLLGLSASLWLNAQTQQPPLSYWFDKPTSLNGQAVWYGGKPDMWKGGE